MKGSERKTEGGGAGEADATTSFATSNPHPSAASSSVVPIPGTFSWPLAARGKPRRGMLRRAVFSDVQRKALEKMFQKQKYISKPDRKKLAAKLGLKDSQVRLVGHQDCFIVGKKKAQKEKMSFPRSQSFHTVFSACGLGLNKWVYNKWIATALKKKKE